MDLRDRAATLVHPTEIGSTADRYQLTLPQRLANGALESDSGDGNDVIRVPCTSVIQSVAALEESGDLVSMTRGLVNEKVLNRFHKVELLVTGSRVVYQAISPNKDGSVAMGHIRYPWIDTVGFHPKQGFFFDPELAIELQQNFEIADTIRVRKGTFFHKVTFVFDKHFDPSGLAQVIAQRAARYVHQTQEVEHTDELLRAAAFPLLPAPSRGSFATYVLPAPCDLPDGRFNLGNTEHPPTWRLRPASTFAT